jgi:hypothetical protein
MLKKLKKEKKQYWGDLSGVRGDLTGVSGDLSEGQLKLDEVK